MNGGDAPTDSLNYINGPDAVRWLLETAPTLVIVGSGVSMPAPTCVPGVAPFLKQTLDLLEAVTGITPSNPVDEPDDFRRRIFPEICYGAIAEAFRTDTHLKIWEIFNRATAARLGARPNSGHLAIVHLAAACGWPVITTNYDCFLEMAAEESGIPHRLDIPRIRDRAVQYVTQPGAMTLIKMHGSAEEPKTIRSTVGDLSRLARVLDRMTFMPAPERILLIGYSGRDFDLFPYVARLADRTDVLWIDPAHEDGDPSRFKEDHRAHHLNHARRSRSVRVYMGYWNDLVAALPDAPRRTVTNPAADKVRKERYLEAVSSAVEDHLGGLLRSDPGTTLAAFGGVLGGAGQHQDVVKIADRADEITDRSARMQTLLWAAHANSSIDRFKDAQTVIRQARRNALLSRSLFGLGRCSIAAAYARTADARLSVVPVADATSDDWRESLASFAMVLMTTIAYFSPSELARLRLADLSRLPDTSTFRFAADYEEHLIRLMALINRIRTKFPVLKPVMVWMWRQLARRCAAIGYTWGVFNVSKYLSREDENYQGPAGSVTSGEIMGDLIGQTISLRDAGLYELSQGHEEDARKLLDQALRKARQVGCSSLELKIMLIRVRGGIDPPYREVDIGSILKRAQGNRIRRERDAIVAALTSRPGSLP